MIELVKISVENIQKQGVPYFEIDTWNGINEYLSSLNLNYITQKKKFPLVFLLEETLRGFNLDPDSGVITGSGDIYIFDVAEENKRPLWRIENEFPEIENIRDNLIESLKQNMEIIDFSSYDKIVYDDSLLNKLEMRVNAFHLGLEIEYENEC